MKKWIILLISAIVLVFLFGIFTYHEIMNNKTKGHDEAIVRAKEEEHIQTVIATSSYARRNAYVVIKGKNKEGEIIYVFVPREKGDIMVAKASDGITESQARELLREKVQYQRILSVQLGIEDGSPLWEITYIDNQNRLTYYYLDFKTGEYWGIRALS